ncbi:MAG: LacI family DNA-binding transcriptional regulator [Lachnospiraceae bacterium]
MISTIYDVAKLAGVSTATVSRVLNRTGNVSPDTEKKVYSAMQMLNFTPNALAQNFAHNKSSIIGFMTSIQRSFPDDPDVDTTTSIFHSELFRGINAIMEREGINLLVINSKDNMEHDIVTMFKQKKIDGLIIGHLPDDTATFRALIESKMPIVYIGHIHNYNKGLHVYAEYNQYLNTVLEYFYQTGHRKVFFICMREPDILIREWEDMGFFSHRKMEVIFVYKNMDQRALHETMKASFGQPNPPTGIFSELISDIQPIISTLTSLNLKVPEDVSLVSVEHILDQGTQFYPQLTDIHVPVVEMGKASIQLLLDYMNGKITPEEYDREVVIHSPLLIRKSSI